MMDMVGHGMIKGAHTHTHTHLHASIPDQSVLVQDHMLIREFAMKTMKATKKAMASPAAAKTLKAVKNATEDSFLFSTHHFQHNMV